MKPQKPQAIDLFCGGGGFTQGARDAGIEVVAAFEVDSAIASVYADNHGQHIQDRSVTTVDFRQYEGIDFLLASPPCQEYSSANTNPNLSSDRALVGFEVIRAILESRPRNILLENVTGYAKSTVFRYLEITLKVLGYKYKVIKVDAADYGVPQNRKRVLLMASLDRNPIPPQPTHAKEATLFHQPWNGWYGAIADLIPTLPETELAPWQEKRLPAWVKNSFLIDGKANKYGESVTIRKSLEPSFSICASAYKQLPKALLVPKNNQPRPRSAASPSVALLIERVGARRDRDLIVRKSHQPSNTVKALGKDRHWRQNDALLGSKCVKVTVDCLARFQTFPQDYRFPKSNSLACKIVGNAKPPLLARSFLAQMI